MNPSLFSRVWRWLHVRAAAQQRRRTSDALVLCELRERIEAEEQEAKRIADKIAAAKLIGKAITDGHAAAKADKTRANHLRVKRHIIEGMECTYGLN